MKPSLRFLLFAVAEAVKNDENDGGPGMWHEIDSLVSGRTSGRNLKPARMTNRVMNARFLVAQQGDQWIQMCQG